MNNILSAFKIVEKDGRKVLQWRNSDVALTEKGKALAAALKEGAELGQDEDGNLIAVWPDGERAE